MAKKQQPDTTEQVSVQDQLEEVSRMTNAELEYVSAEDDKRPGIVRQFATAILDGDISDTLRIIKEASKMETPEIDDDIPVEQLAIGDDDEAFYVALIQQNVAQLTRKNASPQEVARLSQNINIFRKELRDIRSRRPKAGTTLERVLAAAAASGNKRAEKPKATKKRAKTLKKTVSSGVKSKNTVPKAAGAPKSKKLSVTPSKPAKKAKK